MEVGKVIKRGEDLFFFFFFFFLLFTFENDGNLFCTQTGIFYREKAFHVGKKKKTGKITLPPQKNMPVTPLVRIRNLLVFIKCLKTFFKCMDSFFCKCNYRMRQDTKNLKE